LSEPKLERRIGLGGAVLLSFNGAVGAAIFALPATLAADFGTFSPWLFPLIALGAMLVIWPFARSVGAFPESGGPATYGRVFGRLAGFELGWIYYAARAAAFAANANVLIAYLGRWLPGIEGGLARASALIAVCAGLAIANIVGVKRALQLLAGLTLLKALPLIVTAVVALILFAPIPAPGAPPPLSDFEAGALLVFYAFVGFENLVVPAGETRQPAITLPRAILLSIGATTLLYFLVQLAFVTVFPSGGADADAPLVDLGSRIIGPAGAVLLTLAAIASLAGNLHGIMAAVPRP
jgi:basic amino acid/polyamine antiporter, APA family